ncbi:MAG: class II aldolase/adducin family protein [Bacillota bacterium]
MQEEEKKRREEVVEVGRRLWQRGYVAANDGNISLRLGPDEFLCTPAGVSKGFLRPEMLVKVNGRGERLAGELAPSSELRMHLAIYRHRPDVRAVVHAHPPLATAFAVAGIPLAKPVLAEAVLALGRVPLVPYATPGSEELAARLAAHLPGHDAFLLANHGAVTLGRDLWEAYYKMETLEHFAIISLAARLLGGGRKLSPAEVAKLLALRKSLSRQEGGEDMPGDSTGP